MEIQHLQKQLIDLHRELFLSDFLNEHYKTLRDMEEQPGFLMNAMRDFLGSSDEEIMEARNLLRGENVDFDKVHELLFRVKGAAACIGAQRIVRACQALQNCCVEASNKERALQLVEFLKKEHFLLKSKLETLFELERQIISSRGRVEKWW